MYPSDIRFFACIEEGRAQYSMISPNLDLERKTAEATEVRIKTKAGWVLLLLLLLVFA